ncbi:hypothetical protein HOD29_04955 [archaeon]|jgi:hypothetical protein|nr:hypothetical protein [archaeon]
MKDFEKQLNKTLPFFSGVAFILGLIAFTIFSWDYLVEGIRNETSIFESSQGIWIYVLSIICFLLGIISLTLSKNKDYALGNLIEPTVVYAIISFLSYLILTIISALVANATRNESCFLIMHLAPIFGGIITYLIWTFRKN